MGSTVKTLAKQSKMALRAKRLRDGRWTLFIDDNSQPKRKQISIGIFLDNNKSLDGARKESAIQIFNQYCNKKVKEKYQIDNSPVDITLVDYFTKVRSQKNYASNWSQTHTHVKRFFGFDILLSQITISKLNEFQSYLLGRLSRNTAIDYFNILNIVLNQAFREELIKRPVNKFTNSLKRTEIPPRYLTAEQVQLLINALPSDVTDIHRAFLFSCFTGLRKSDLHSLQWKHIRNTAIHIIQKKYKKPNVIPLSDVAMRWLPEQSDSYVFDMQSRFIQERILRKWSEDTGLNKLTFHMARHTFATMLVEKNVNIVVVKELLGHSNIRTTMVYAKIGDKLKTDAVQLLNSNYEQSG